MVEPTLAEVIERAAGLETQLHGVYESFAGLFSAEPEAVRFWRAMAEDERVHASLLVETLSTYSPERLAEQADSKLVNAVDGV